MKTTRLIAAAAIAMLALASCGSGDDEAATDTLTTDTSAPQEDTGGADADDSASDNDDADADASSDAGDPAPDPNDAPDDDATVIGGELDEQSAAWFSAFCTGMAPFAAADNFLGNADDAGTLAEQQQQTVDGLNTIADAMGDTAKQLDGMPGPTMAGGQEMADSMLTGLADAAPAIRSSADALAAVDPSDDEALEQQIGLAGLSVFGAIAGSGLSQFQLDPELQASLATIPECAPFADLGDMVAGG